MSSRPDGDPRAPRVSPASVVRRLVSLALPVIGTNLLGVVLLLVDSAVCGRLPDGKTALGALAYSFQLLLVLMVAMLGLASGTVALISRAHGAGDTDRVNQVLNQSTVLAAGMGVAVGGITLIFLEPLLRALGAQQAVLESATTYLRPLLMSTPLSYLIILYNGALRGVGNTRLALLFSLVANVVNGIATYGLTLGRLGMPALGVQGAALGTVLAYVVNLTLLIALLRRGRIASMKLSLRPQRIDRQTLREIVRIGAPGGLELVINALSYLGLVALLGRADHLSVAAHGVGSRLQSLATIPGIAISQATGALIGMALGASNVDRARQTFRSALVLAAVVMAVLGIANFLCAPTLVRLFDIEPGSELATQTVTWIRISTITLLLTAFHVTMTGTLAGAGATATTMRISIVTMAIQVPIAVVLAFPVGLGPIGVWASYPIGMAVKVILDTRAYRRGDWVVTGIKVRAPKPVATRAAT